MQGVADNRVQELSVEIETISREKKMSTKLSLVYLYLTVSVLPTPSQGRNSAPPFKNGLPGIYFADIQSDQYYNPIEEPCTASNLSLDITTNTGAQVAASSRDRIYFTGGAPDLRDVRVLTLERKRAYMGPALLTGRVLHSAIWLHLR